MLLSAAAHPNNSQALERNADIVGDPCILRFTAEQTKPFISRVWPLVKWERGKPKPIVIRVYKRRLLCAAGPGHRKAIRKRWRKSKLAFYRHREHKLEQRERLRYLPFACGGGVRSAIPCSIMFCESKGSYTARNPSSTAGGRYQIIDSTFYEYGGRPNGDSHPAAAAPPAEQDRIAAAIYADVGSSAWVCT